MKTFKPCVAIWRTKDSDLQVKVLRSLGLDSQGREYVAIEGSDVGIPLDELEEIKSQQRSEKPSTRNTFLQFGGK